MISSYMAYKNESEEVFDSIAEHFDRTRRTPWKEVVDFLDTLKGDVLDLCCGNGRHCCSAVERGLNTVGLDASEELLKIAKKNCPEAFFIRGDARYLPIKDETFDAVLYIAGIHHLREGRVRSLRECKRVLRSGGRMLVSSWSKDADRWDLGEDEKDVMVPWTRDDGVVFQRYYHLYTLEELEGEVIKAHLTVEDSFSSGENNYVVGVRGG